MDTRTTKPWPFNSWGDFASHIWTAMVAIGIWEVLQWLM